MYISMDSLHPERKVKRIIWKRSKSRDAGKGSSEKTNSSAASQQAHVEKRRRCDDQILSALNYDIDSPCLMPLLSISSIAECSSKAPVDLSGTACRGGIGPHIGAMDIGTSKSAYYFRIALPGVKKDPGEFCCEIERDGKVHIRGVTSTGGGTVSRYSRVFEMKIQHHSPPGPFTISFSLPGPVDPRLFLPNFSSCSVCYGGLIVEENCSTRGCGQLFFFELAKVQYGSGHWALCLQAH